MKCVVVELVNGGVVKHTSGQMLTSKEQ